MDSERETIDLMMLDPKYVKSAKRGRCAVAIVVAFVALVLAGTARAQERVSIETAEALLAFFESLDYTPEAWQAGIRVVPRVYIMTVGQGWRIESKNIPVIDKKRIFFRALGPLVLRANELVLDDRERLLRLAEADDRAADDADWLRELAARYGVSDGPDIEPDTSHIVELLSRVDAVPVSLALAQGAEESGWGTSRFAAEGNSLFGQWSWGGKGITPKDQRADLGDYKIAAFDTPLDSVKAYMMNINTHAAYSALRERRAGMREAGEMLSGWELAKTLTKYSERGQAYVETLHTIMRVNRLQPTDEAVLADGPAWHIYPSE